MLPRHRGSKSQVQASLPELASPLPSPESGHPPPKAKAKVMKKTAPKTQTSKAKATPTRKRPAACEKPTVDGCDSMQGQEPASSQLSAKLSKASSSSSSNSSGTCSSSGRSDDSKHSPQQPQKSKEPSEQPPEEPLLSDLNANSDALVFADGVDADDNVNAHPALQEIRSRDASLPDGPKTLVEAHQWAIYNAGALKRIDPGNGECYKTNASGAYGRTLYSGMGCTEMAMRLGVAGFEKQGYALTRSIAFQQACDRDANCRKVLMSHTEPPEHVLGDINDRLTETGLAKIKDAEKLNQIDKENAFGEKDLSKLTKEQLNQHRYALNVIGLRCVNRLMAVLHQAGVMRRRIKCYTHDSHCDLSLRTTFHEFMVTFDVTGTVCTPWSSMGSMLGFCDATSCRIFCVYLMDLINFRPTFILHECTVRFDWSVFVKYMPNYTWESELGDTFSFGLPGTRRRRLTLGTKNGVSTMAQSLRSVSVLHRNVEMNGDAYFMEPEDEVLEYKKHLAGNAMAPSTASWEEIVGVLRHRRIMQYRTMPKVLKLQNSGKCRIFNVDQNPLDMPMVSDLMPCQLRHCNLWSDMLQRLLTPRGHLGVSLVPMWPHLAQATGVPWPFFAHVPSNAQMTSMSGNAQNLCFIGSHLQFIFCHLRLTTVVNAANRQGLNRMPDAGEYARLGSEEVAEEALKDAVFDGADGAPLELLLLRARNSDESCASF